MMDIGLQSALGRIKRRNITEAGDAMVAILQTLSPRDHGELWDELGRSEKLCEAFKTTKTNKFGSSQSVIKYLPCRSVQQRQVKP